MDYTYFYKTKYNSINELEDCQYDVFISAFNDSERVKQVFYKLKSKHKYWLVFSEYDYKPSEINTLNDENAEIVEFANSENEASIINNFINRYKDIINIDKSICIDITGFIRPHLLFLIRKLFDLGFDKVDFIYTDPVSYKQRVNTDFSFESLNVRHVAGFAGSHNTSNENDYLIIAAGYDHERIRDVAKYKDQTTKIQLFGFPSLQPDMFQENIEKAYRAAPETVSDDYMFIDEKFSIFAPANDPFVTAKQLSDFVKKVNKKKTITNLYLSPLSTKVQTLGFALYYIGQCLDQPVSVIFPFCSKYSKETSTGISKIWIYSVEFNLFR
ncbi:hypothetical protein I6I98_13025 [Sphingobacterium multivorum]|uniref:Uncharacterized protein n=1 Tax=Sphingobacterium multivorum TaxID=28454 RepID=A0ABX7CXH3_SPHMU|nr:hypothetical protein [Sphingobacterium multivorum]QQT56125.1 hypothetical protein I6I98_13025 [Sphingobacterium multivorum]